ncbi:MAG: 6-bladed beta-propeller [Cyclobacteriaceae bacterium]
MYRRDFIKTSGLALGATTVPLFYINKGIAKSKSEVIVGHGDFKYKVHKNWGIQDPSKFPVKDCHEMVMDSKGRLILLTNEPKNNVLIYDKSGKVLDSWTLDLKGAHGLTINDEGGQEFLYIADTRGKVVKADLKGKLVMELAHPAKVGTYTECNKYNPTETAIAPNGDIYIADGYGSQWILHFDSKGNFIKKFGGGGSAEGKFLQAHGVTLDTRDKNSPTLLCTARKKNAFKRYSLEGEFLETIYLPGAFLSRAVIDGDNIYSGVCFSSNVKYNLPFNSGFVTILDKENKVVSNPGGTKPTYKKGKLQTMIQEDNTFVHCHDVCVDEDKNLYVCQWNANKTYPVKLERV